MDQPATMDETAPGENSTVQYDIAKHSPAVLQRRVALVMVALVILAALSLRLLTFDRYLPFLEHPDESTYYTIAATWRGTEDFSHLYDRYGGLPPIYLHLHVLVQEAVDLVTGKNWALPSQDIYALRVLSVLFTTLAAGAVIAFGWDVGGPSVGIIAGMIWGLSPIIIEDNSFAVPDPLVYLFLTLTFFTSLRAWQTKSPRWLLASLLTGILTILTKYWLVTAVLPFGVMALVFFYREPRKMIRWMVLYGVIALLSVLYLFLIVKPFDVPAPEINTFKDSGLVNALSIERNLRNWGRALVVVGAKGLFGRLAFVGVMLAGVAAYLVNRRRRQAHLPDRLILLFTGAWAVLTMMMASSFADFDLFNAHVIRHLLPASILLYVLFAVALVQIVRAVGANLAGANWLRYVPVIAALVILLPTYVPEDVALVQRFAREHGVVTLWRWADTTLQAEGDVISHPRSLLADAWNRPWSGYDGNKPFFTWGITADEILAKTPQEWAGDGKAYFILTEGDRLNYYLSEPMQAYMDSLTLQKTVVGPSDLIDGDNIYIYRTLPPQYRADALYGGQIQLAGYDLSNARLQPGDTLMFRPFWHIAQLPAANYSMFMHLYPAEVVELVSQQDGALSVPERPTTAWDDLDELYVGTPLTLTVPEGTAPGEYRLVIGVYDYVTGVRLTLPDGADFYAIPITISE